MSTTTGALITTFGHSAAGQVAALVRAGSHLIAGGYFSGINGSTTPYLVSLNLATGADDGYANLNISGNYVYQDASGASALSNATRIWNFALSPDSSKLLATGDFMSVGGVGRQQIFMLDLGASRASVDPWYSTEFNQYCDRSEPFHLQDASWSPDMSAVYVATTGYKPASGPGYRTSDPRAGLCDAAAAFPSTASSTVSHLWVNYTGCDSLFSTAADASTVYVGGQERFANNGNRCDGPGSGSIAAPGMGGLSPTTGLLSVNPTRDRGNGPDDEVITSAGLWVGSDKACGSSACGVDSVGDPATGHAGICFLPYATPPVPTSSFTTSCPNQTCYFDGSASTAPGSTITSYAWDFGDGTTGSGVNPSHSYGAAGSYTVTLTVTLTVTNAANESTASSQQVSVGGGVVTPGVAFVGSASTTANATTESVTVPPNVSAGNGLLLVASGASGSVMTAPAGWAQVDSATSSSITSTLWERVATAADAGSLVTVNFPAPAYHGTVSLLAYSGTNASNPVVAYAKKVSAGSATSYVTPVASVPANDDTVVSVWSAKSSAVTAWTAPASQTVRATANGSGSGRINSLASDVANVSAGPAGGVTATTDAAGSAFAAWTVVLGG